MPSKSLLAIACVMALAPVTVQARSAGDPYEKFNRRSFAFSMKLDHYIIGPLARLSHGLTPGPVVKILNNVIVNLSEPQVILNDILQLRPQRAIAALTRLIVNTSFGLGGALDLAAGAGLPYHPNGFGDTLGHYGVHPGPYLYIPVLGPSDLRDIFGSGVDQVSSPMVWIDFPYRTPINLSLGIAGGLNRRAEAGPQLDALLSSAADPYATLRSTYLQAREAQIRGQTALPPLPDIEGPGEASPSAGPETPGSPMPDIETPPTETPPAAGQAPGTPETAPPQAAPTPPAPDSGVSPSPTPAPPAPEASPGEAPSAVPSPASPPSPANS
ncbi:MAG: VacJ family lipoprotein [Caulobacteraceae bacterium]|nr:VacJ family lipoprotein [Caulobacteraceae bacterium]